MRIFVLPISTRQALIYCQKPAAQANAKPTSYADRAIKKAADTWAKWEEAEKGWQKTIVTYGNAGLKRISYQEWGLKSFPPSNPKLESKEVAENKKFDVVYPGNILHNRDVPKVLERLAKDRKALHWNRFIGSMIAMPLTIPFALVPVIPNIPFFYATYRCWSHWRALKGSDHLENILNHRLYRPISTKEVEELYDHIAPNSPDFNFVTASQIGDSTLPKEKLILTAKSHTVVARVLQVPELSGEIERAVWQVENQMKQEEATATVSKKLESGTANVDEERKTKQ